MKLNPLAETNSILLILGNNSLRSFVGHSLFKIDCVPFSPFVVI